MPTTTDATTVTLTDSTGAHIGTVSSAHLALLIGLAAETLNSADEEELESLGLTYDTANDAVASALVILGN